MNHVPVRRPRVDYRKDLADFLKRPGPYLSLYLDVGPGPQRESAEQRLLQALEIETCSSEATLDPSHWEAAGNALSLVAEDDATLVSFIAADGGSLTTGYPEPPKTDFVGLANLPRLGPLLQAEQSLVHHVVAVVEGDSLGLATIPRHGEAVDARYEAGDRAAIPSLIQHTARVSETNLVLLCADSADLALLTAQVQAGLPATTVVKAIDSEGLDDAQLASQLVVEAADHAARKTVEVIRLWRFHNAHQEAVTGQAAIDALAAGQAALILLNDDFEDDRQLLFGPGPTPVMYEFEPTDHRGQGLSKGRMADVIIGASLALEVPIHIVPNLGQTLDDGLGVILADRAETASLTALLES